MLAPAADGEPPELQVYVAERRRGSNRGRCPRARRRADRPLTHGGARCAPWHRTPESPPGSAAIAESATLAVDAKAKALKAAGRPVIGFGAGEPDFPTPDYIVEAAVAACRDPQIPPLHAGRRAARAAGGDRRQDRCATPGYDGRRRARCSSPTAASRRSTTRSPTLLDPGDEVLLPAPYWTTYPEAITLAGGVPVEVLTDETTGFLRHRRPARGGTAPPRPRCCCSSRRPTRPARSTRPRRSRRSAGGPSSTGIWVVTDEIYEHLVYGDAEFTSMPVARARARRPVRRAQRRGQDLRDDRLAGRLDDRAARRRSRRPPTCSRTRRRTSPTSPRRPRSPRCPATCPPSRMMREAFDRRRQTHGRAC